MAFRYIIAQTEEEKRQCYSLRYQIYVEEFGFEPPNSQRIETDEFDENSVHILAYENGTNNVAGTARLVLPSSKGLPAHSFPAKLEYPENYKQPPDTSIVEMSRVAVAKAYRRATQNRAAFGENQSPPSSPPASPRSNNSTSSPQEEGAGGRVQPQKQDPPTPSSPPVPLRQSISPLSPRRSPPPTPPKRPLQIQLQQQQPEQPSKVESPPSSPRGLGQGPELMLGLLCKSFLAAQSLDYDYVLFVTEAKIVHSCTHYGLGAAFVQIGQMVEYHGVRRAPYIAKLSEALDKAEELNPAVHSYILREKREAEMGRPIHTAMTAPTPSLRRHLLTRQKSVSQMAAFFDAPIGSY